MKTSAAGRVLITQREGRCLTAYHDTRGILTIGVGHVDMSPPKVTPGMRITEGECDAMLAADLAPVERAIGAAVKVQVSQNEFDAMASLGFNIGVGGLKGSSVVKRLNMGDVHGAAQAFMNWCKPAELTGRRRAEQAQFLKPDEPTAHDATPTVTVATARAATLSTKAVATKSKANVAQASAGTFVAAGAVIAAAAPSHTGFAIAGVFLALGIAVTAFAVLAHRKADTLKANAAKQVPATA